VIVFATGVATLRAIGDWLGSRRVIVAIIQRWGRRIVPIVFMAIGVAIFLEASR
jgi:cadmium resistance protein CadD (predicted permease)